MFSTTSKYALRALVELARRPQGEAIGGQQLAESARIPPQYLSKIMLALRHAGYVTATRGMGGGYQLVKPADSIPLIEVIEVFEGPAARPQCFLGVNSECNPDFPCSAHSSWGELRAMYLRFLEHTMVSDISRVPERPPVPGEIQEGERR